LITRFSVSDVTLNLRAQLSSDGWCQTTQNLQLILRDGELFRGAQHTHKGVTTSVPIALKERLPKRYFSLLKGSQPPEDSAGVKERLWRVKTTGVRDLFEVLERLSQALLITDRV
jgi:hypothetical protein